VLEC